MTNSKEGRMWRIAEVPRGEELIEKTIDKTRKALFDTYPTLQNEEFIHRIPDLSRIQVISHEEMKDKEREVRSADNNLIYLTLKKMGVPQKELDDTYYMVKDKVFLYWKGIENDTPVYLDEEFVRAGLSNSIEEIRTDAAMTLGSSIIHTTISTIPEQTPLQPYPWREIVKSKVTESLPTLKERNPNITDEIIKNSEEILHDWVSMDDVSYAAYGGAVHVIFPGEDVWSSEYRIGTDFNSYLTFFFSKDVKNKFFGHMRNALIGVKKMYYEAKPTAYEKRADKLLRQIFTNRHVFDKKAATEAYFSSTLPQYFHESTSVENPWAYPD